MSTNERREELIRILRGGQRTSITRLMQQLNVSRSTINRDLQVLTVERHYPIQSEVGRAGGVYMQNYRHMHKRILSQQQIKALNTAIASADIETAASLQGILAAYA